MSDLKGKAALVTGGSSGIGLATVELFSRRGAKVALNHLPDDKRGTDTAAKLRAEGLDVIAAPGDVSKAGAAERMVGDAIQKLGRLDYLANNAGTPNTKEPIPSRDMDKLTQEFWMTILNTNLIGPFRCTHAAASALRAARGAVCNTASVAGLNMAGSSMAYGASKAGLISLTKNFARALAPEARLRSSGHWLVHSVATKPGATALARASGARARAKFLVRLIRPALLAP